MRGLNIFQQFVHYYSLLPYRARAADATPISADAFGRAKSCILLFMWGGPAHQDTWDLKPLAPAEVRGEFRPISTKVPGIQICEHFPQLAQRTDRLAIVRSMTHTDVDHLTGTHYLLTPNLEIGVRVGWGLNQDAANFFANTGVGWRW